MHTPTRSQGLPTPLAEREIQTQIQQALGENLTGQIHVSFLNNRTETIFVCQGKVRQVYIRNHRTPSLKWKDPLIRFGRGTIEVEPLPARAMPFRKILLETLAPVNPQLSRTAQLKTMFSLAEHNSNPTMFHIQWEYAEGFVIVAGRGIPIQRAVILTDTGSAEGNAALDQLSAWHEPECNVEIHRGDIRNQAWLEVHLNILFEWHCRNILDRYKQLTGNVVVRSVLYNCAVLASHHGWQISTHDQELSDSTIFLTAAEAGTAYREVVRSIKSQIEPVIGSALTQDLLQRAKSSPRDIYRTIENVFNLIEETE